MELSTPLSSLDLIIHFFLQETPTLLSSAFFIEMHLSLPVLSRWMNLPSLSCGGKSLVQS